MNNLLPNTTTATELQRNYKKVVRMVKRIKQPLTVLSNNKPELIIMDYATFNKAKQPAKSVIQIDSDIATGKTKHADFSEFFGIWTKEEAEEFERNTAIFEEIDEEMWRT